MKCQWTLLPCGTRPRNDVGRYGGNDKADSIKKYPANLRGVKCLWVSRLAEQGCGMPR